MVHGIHRETELFKRYHSKDWLGALLAEHDDCRLCPRAQADVDPRHWVADLASISQDERPFVLGHDRESFQYIAVGHSSSGTTASLSSTSRGTQLYVAPVSTSRSEERRV